MRGGVQRAGDIRDRHSQSVCAARAQRFGLTQQECGESSVAQISGLTVRQHEREGIRVPVALEVCADHATQVQFSAASGALGQRIVRATATDISPGGMGLESRHFLPRMCEGVLRIFDPSSADPTSEAGEPPVLFEHRVKVRRVHQISSEPSYALGVAFVDVDADFDRRVDALLNQLRARGANADTNAFDALKQGGGHA